MPNGRVHRHGLHDPIRPHATDLSAFEHPATTGIGILTAYPYVVVDIDGEEGAQTWRDLAGEDDWLPPTWVAKTGRGLHVWLSTWAPTGSMKLGPLLDLKGDGGYVAAPPSLHPDGHRYEWLVPPSEYLGPCDVPERLRERIAARAFDREGSLVRKVQQRRVRHDSLEDGILYATWGFDHLIEGMRNETVGNRNNYLHWAAAVMAEEGASEEEFEALHAAAPDLGVAARRTIRSARRKYDAG